MFDITRGNYTYVRNFLYPTMSNKAVFWTPQRIKLEEIINTLYDPDSVKDSSTTLSKTWTDYALRVFGTDPQKAIISCRLYPCNFNYVHTTTMTIMGFNLGICEKMPENRLGLLYDLGHIEVPYFQNVDSYLSYEPYTKMFLYLPFAKLVTLDTKRYSGKTLQINGAIDFYNGDMYYFLSTTENGEDYTLIEEVKAHIAVDLPMYSSNVFEQIQSAIKSVFTAVPNFVLNENTGGLTNWLNQAHIGTNEMMSANLSGLGSFLAPLKCTLIIYRPRVKYALGDSDYNHLNGVPCKKIGILNSFSGFTQISKIHTPDIPSVTADEMTELENILREGVILDNTSAIFSINFTGSHISWNYQPTTLQYGSPLSTTYTIENGYQLDSIKVYMGSNDITSTAVSGNVVVISQVTGNVSIVTEASKIPVTYTITSNLNGATLTNSAITVLEGDSYSTGIEPNYNTGHIGKNYEPDVYIGGVPYTSGVSTFEVIVDSVTSNIVIEGTYPSVSTMNVSNWSMRSGTVNLPANVETATGVRITTSLGQVESTGSVVFDNSPDTLFNNAFISFEGNVIGGASNVTIGMNQTGNVFYLDGQNNIVNVGYITNLQFLDTDSWTTQATLLEYMDKNFMYNG